jgi:hypothetical protein
LVIDGQTFRVLKLTPLSSPETENDQQFAIGAKYFDPAITKIADGYSRSIRRDLKKNTPIAKQMIIIFFLLENVNLIQLPVAKPTLTLTATPVGSLNSLFW